MAEYDAGTAKGKITLDTSEVKSGASEYKDSASEIEGTSEKAKGSVLALGAALVTVGAAAATALAVGLEKIGSSFDEAFDHIRVTTGATGVELDNLQDSFKNVVSSVPASFGDASVAIATLNQQLGLTGKPLEDAATQILNLSRITGTDLKTNVEATSRVFNSWGISVADQAPKLDELFRVSQLTGISVADLATQMAENGVKARAVGLDYEQTASLLGLLAKNGLSAGDVMPALTRAMANAAKEGKDATTVFRDTFDAIKNAPSDTEAAAVALEIFGARAGPQFAALIREGKLSYEEMAAAIAAGGDTINQAATDTDDWREKLKVLINKGLVALEPIASKVFETVSKAVEAVSPFVREVAAWLGEHLPAAMKVVSDWVKANWPTIQEVIITVFDAIKTGVMFIVEEVLPPLLGAMQATFGWLMDNKEFLIGIAAALAVGIGAVFTVWAAGALAAAAATIAAAAPFYLIGAAIAAVVGGVIYAYNHFQTFRDVIDAIGRFLRDVLWPVLQSVFNWLMDNVPPIIQAIIDVHMFLWNNVLKPLATFLIDVFKVHWDIITTAIGFVIDVVDDLWHNFLQPLLSFLEGVFTTALGAVGTALDTLGGFFTALKDTASGAVDDVVGFITDLPGKLLGLVGDFLSAGTELGGQILQGFQDGLSAVAGFAGDVADAVLGAVKDAWNALANLINDFIPNSLGWGPFSIDLPNNPIPTFRSGGVVSQDTLAMLHRPEVVVPLNQPDQALALMRQTGLDQLLAGSSGRGASSAGQVERSGALMQVGEYHVHEAADATLLMQQVEFLVSSGSL